MTIIMAALSHGDANAPLTVMSHSLTVIVPTIGRKSLRATLESFAPDLRAGDVVHVCMDGRNDLVRRLTEEMSLKYFGDWYYHEGANRGAWGHYNRNDVLSIVHTDLVWMIDDDDIAAPEAVKMIRSAESPWTVFRMEFKEGHQAKGVICWREKRLKYGDIGTPMIVARPCSARYGLEYDGDWVYAQELEKYLGPPAWDDRIIALIRPEMGDEGNEESESNFLPD